MLMNLKTMINPVKSLDKTFVWAYIGRVDVKQYASLKKIIETDIIKLII